MAAPRRVVDLVELFHRNIDAYRSGRYNEAQVRREFIDPMFRALGWDVDNERGYAEAYKDVIHEDSISVGGATKAPDYCFRIGGTRKFFLEAKKPSIDIKRDVHPAYQLRRYAWSAKLPLSILTDFEEFAAYDCRVRPARGDKASTARVMYVTFDQYLDQWDEIAAIFSREAVLKGSFDRFAEKGRKRGTAEVDDAFLREIETWRADLARNIALRNSDLTQRELNFAVQRTIDRIIFLRICEDRGIEDAGRLQALLNGSEAYARLMQLFHRADERYNSGLFHFHREKGRAEPPDDLTPELTIDDKVLKAILARLYYPESPYEFSVLPADILGQVYEQFLGKVIRLTRAHRAVVEDKPEVKKAGGVYYTPTYIVDYIVKHTVGQLLEGKTPRQATSLRILDPACGSGSFLIGAYQYLLDWHRDRYVADDPEKRVKGRNPRLYQASGGDWRLTTAERKRILLNNIFGVDIDTQAVEVTKLSLLLKVLEGESGEALERQRRLFHERALPDLADNIKCGNSLIGPDFYDGQQLSLLDDDDRYRINAFDWHAEFPAIFKRKSPGFDAVIGNPPYVFGEYHNPHTKLYLVGAYVLAERQYDTYRLFLEQGLMLTRSGGTFGMIVPDALLVRDEADLARKMLIEAGLQRLYHCGLVFSASVSAVVVVVGRGTEPSTLVAESRTRSEAVVENLCSVARFKGDPRFRFTIHASDTEAALIRRVSDESESLNELGAISRGEEIGKKAVFPDGPIPILVGEDVSRYRVSLPSRFVTELAKDERLYRAPKILVVKTGASCIAALENQGTATMQSVYNVHLRTPDLSCAAVIAVLNSRFIDFFLKKTFTAYKLLFPQMNQTTLGSLPIPPLLFERQGEASERVEQMERLVAACSAARTPNEQQHLLRQVAATDRQIDQLVYGLYGLTEKEIRIVEEATAG